MGIAAGTQDRAYVQCDTSGDFFIQSMRATVRLVGGAQNSAALSASPTAASNTGPLLSHFRLQLTVSGVDWFNVATRLNHVAGDTGNPFFFQTLPALALQAQLVGTFFNDWTAAVTADITFFGYKRLLAQ